MASSTDRPPSAQPPPFLRSVNRLMVRTIAGRRLYGRLRHQGRRSGKVYETPVVAWRTAGGMLVPLSWGTKADWYRNIVAAGGCDLQLRGRWYRCEQPRLLQRDEALAYLPPAARILSGAFGVRQFVLLPRVQARA